MDHDPIARASRNPGTVWLYTPAYLAERRMDAGSVRAATRLITNSRYTAAAIRDAYGRDATVIRMGVPDGFTPGAPGAATAYVLSVGTLIPSKGHDLAIAAAARARRRSPVVIVAPRSAPAEEARLRALAAEQQAQLQIRVGVSDLELRDLYRGALATTYLAVAEPLGLVALEAQACGCPVIVSAEGGLPETIVEGSSGWAVARDPGAVASKLDLLSLSGERVAAGVRAAAHGARFSWAASTGDLQAILDEVVSA
jgi:glycosyltransferase involved in cell wall biosynthesis